MHWFTYESTDLQTNRQTRIQKDKLLHRQANNLTDKPSGRQTIRQAYQLTDKPTDRPTNQLTEKETLTYK